MINFCSGCNGRGKVGWLWWAKVCPVCKAETPKRHGSFMHPIPPKPWPPAPPPAPPKR